MKKVLSIITVLTLVVSCDILEPEPRQALSTEGALVDAASVEGVLLGAYSLMQDDDYYGVEYMLNPDLLADNSVFEGFFDSQLELDQLAVPITNLWIGNCWPDIYLVINTANLIIADIDGIDDPNLDADAVLSEAYAIRALAYFDLLRVFGEFYDTNSAFGVPILLEPITGEIPNLPRNTVAETYAQILSDLGTAIDLGAGGTDPERMNYYAALSLRARVNLYRGDYASAFADADEVIGSGEFLLEPSLDDVFFTTEPSGESIFEVEFNDQDQSAFNTFTIRRDEYNADADLLASFEPGDLRANYFVNSRGRDRTAKYLDNTNANNAKVFRLAELYLIRSEAAVFSSGNPNAGSADLNAVRNRAGLPDVGTFATTDEYVDALQYERRAELNFEGHRFFDLVRLGQAQEVLGVEEFRWIMPIPRDELQVSSNLVQNPGYESQ